MPEGLGYPRKTLRPAGGNPIARGVKKALTRPGMGGGAPSNNPTPRMMKRAMREKGGGM